MSSTLHDITEHDLHALVDGQLPHEKLSRINDYLHHNPEEAKKLASWELQKKGLKAIFDPVIDEPLPKEMLKMTKDSAQTPVLFRVAAVLAWITIGTVFGWFIHAAQITSNYMNAPPEYVERAAMAHAVYLPEVRHPVEVDASEEKHLTKWLSKRLKGRVKIPHFTDTGFNLIGGRLLPGVDNAAAQFMYENKSGDRLTLYVNKADNINGETAFHYAEQKNASLFYWIDPEFAYALVGQIPRESLLKLAHQVYQQLSDSDPN